MIATAHHDFKGSHTLFSYCAMASDDIGQAEAIAKNLYGKILSGTKSPSTLFLCTWRSPGKRNLRGKRPQKVFLSCNYGPAPVQRPKSLVKLSKLYNTIDRANLKATWKLIDGLYRIIRFEVEIRTDKKSFRSEKLTEDLAEIRIEQKKMKFPEDGQSLFLFDLRANLQERNYQRKRRPAEPVSVSFSGRAEPIPDWVNY